MEKIKVALTGASGSMGSCSLEQLLLLDNIIVKILLRPSKANIKLAKKLKKQYRDKLEIILGDLNSSDDCAKLIENAKYVIHLAGMIPPKSDHSIVGSKKANFIAIKNLVDCINNSTNKDNIYFIATSTVALYCSRNYKHPWGRVGDPLMPSPYDYYALHKLLGERYLLDNNIPHFVSLRQTAILHKNIFKNNMKDGLMFHTSWNSPLEWVTDVDSGLLIKNLINKSLNNSLPKEFWNKVYNIGGGENNRCTGYDTLNDGFKLMGRTAKEFFKPNWNAYRNFHGVWFYDSHILNDYLDFAKEDNKTFWKRMGKKYWYFKMGKIIPPAILSKLVIQRLFKNDNSPMYWYNHNMTGKIDAFYGSSENFLKISTNWNNFPLLSEGKTEVGPVDYEKAKKESYAEEKGLLLDHGYDENKPDKELDIFDMQKAATFRGGKCLSKVMIKGDIYTKLEWQCSEGHKFMASPYTILKAGHWCNECLTSDDWHFDRLASKNQFYAQVWYDTHDKREINRVYPYSKEEINK